MAEDEDESEYILVTGASAGPRVALAERFAGKEKNVIPVAHREERPLTRQAAAYSAGSVFKWALDGSDRSNGCIRFGGATLPAHILHQ